VDAGLAHRRRVRLEMTRQYSLCGDLPRHSTMSDSGPPCCPLCRGSAEPGWLCEDHPDKPSARPLRRRRDRVRVQPAGVSSVKAGLRRGAER
jgi:hypothetical protein